MLSRFKIFLLGLILVFIELSPLFWNVYKRITLSQPERITLLNNGINPTLNAFFLTPHHIFPENFYLYKVRAKRLLSFGWKNSILQPTQSQYIDLRSAISICWFIPFILLDNNIYQEVFALTLGLSLSVIIMYFGFFRLTQSHFYSLLGIILIHLFTEGRVLRIATTMISYPLLVLLLSFLKDFYDKLHTQQDKKALAYACITIFFIMGVDFRFASFLMIGVNIFIVVLWVKKKISIRYAAIVFSVLLLPLGFWAIPNLIAQQYDSPDVLIRAGLKYQNFHYLLETKTWIGFVIKYFFEWKFSLFFITILIVVFYYDKKTVKSLILIFIIFVVCDLCFSLLNRQQTYSNYGYFLFLRIGIIVFAINFMNHYILFLKKWYYKIAVIFISLVTLVIVTSNWYDRKNFYKEIALQQEAENLITYLKEQDTRHKTLLTLSYEYNFLLAYHTNFELLLPSGFPLHDGRSNQTIINQFLAICDFLKIKNIASTIQWIYPVIVPYTKWNTLGKSYANINFYPYMLFHCADIFMQDIDETLPSRQKFLSYTRWKRNPIFFDIMNQSVDYQTYFSQKPDFVLFDEVSKALCAQLPEGYELVFQNKDLELYRLNSMAN